MTEIIDQEETTTEGALIIPPERKLVSTEARDIRAFMMQQVQNLDVDKMRAFFDLQCQVEDRDAKRAFNSARAAMAPNLPVVPKSGKLEYEDKSANAKAGAKILIARYAKWDDIERVLIPILADHGFVMTFPADPRADGGGLMMRCVLSHEAGHSETTQPFPIPLDSSGGKNNIQAYGSSMAYGMRYTARAMGLFRVEGEDDDGVASGAVPIGPEQAIRLRDLVTEAGIATAKTDEERRAEVAAWFADVLSYPITSYRDIKNEDYARLARMLKSLADQRQDEEREAMKV